MTNKLIPSFGYRFAIALTFMFLGLNLNAQTYCPSKGNLPWTEWIAGVKFGTINNTSSKEGYGDFTSQTTNLVIGTSYPLSITQGFSYAPDAANAPQQGRVWIDYNKNGTFEATELVASLTRTTTTANVVIPTTALTGATRMRVSLKTIGAPTACEVFDKGEVEDYTVNITGGTAALPDLVLRGNLISRIEAGRFFQTGTYYLKNVGSASITRDFYTIYFYLSTDATLSSNDVLIANEYVRDRPTLAAGDSVAISPTNASLGNLVIPAGAYYVIAKADPDDQITEVSETNNTLATATQITVPPTTGRDTLRITNVTGPTTAEPSGTLPLSITIKNFGSVASKPDSIGLLKWRYYDATYAVPYSLNKIAIPAIAAGQSITVTGNFQMPATLVDVTANVGDLYVNIDAAVKTYINFGCSYYGSSDNCLGYRYPIKPATTTDLALTGTVVQGLYSTNSLQVSFKVKLKNVGAKGAKNISVALNNYFSQGGAQYDGIKNVALVSGSGTYKYITVYRSVDQSNQYSTWQIPNLNALDSVEATFTGDIAYYSGGPLPVTTNIAPYILYTDVQDSKPTNDKVAMTFNLANSCRYQDSLQLVSLYNATGGANWTNKWNLATPINTWFGVTLNTNGCVFRLNLEKNNLVGTLPNLNIPNLEWLYIYENKLSGTIPSFNLPNLKNLWLGNNTFTGTIPNFNTPNLVELVLNGNQLTGTIPNFTFPNLKQLQLIENKLTGSIPNFNLPNLVGLLLFQNPLSGSIPNFNLPNLEELLLTENQLTGAIPNFNLPKLKSLWLQNNNLTGTIPNLNLPNVTQLLLSGNQLTGTIPTLNLPNLTNLQLQVNRLTGIIPNFNMPNLIQILLNDNQLSGAIPSFNYPNITNLRLENNNLSGCIPTSLNAYCGKNVSFTNNPLLATQSFTDFCANGLSACVSANDLGLTIAATPSVYRLYQTNTFKITVKNLGSAAFTNVKIQFRFPALTVSGGAAVPSIGNWQEWCSGGVQCFTWTIPTFAGNSTATLDVPLFILDASGGAIVATTTLLSSTPADNNADNNYSVITVNPATAPLVAPAQALAFRVPTQLIPVIIQRISPNPTEGDVQIKLDSWTKQTVDFNFSDITGKIIYSEKRDLEKGLNRLDFDVYHLPQGVYFIQTNVGKGKNVPTKFVKM